MFDDLCNPGGTAVWTVDYDRFAYRQLDEPTALTDFGEAISAAWCRLYAAATPWSPEIVEIPLGQLRYLFDLGPSQSASRHGDDRVVGVYGRPEPASGERDTARQRSFLPDPVKWSHAGYDRGHFVAHALGGGMDINLFPQARDLNRGRSPAGRRWRKLERRATEEGAYLFVRPIYADDTWVPRLIDLGVVASTGLSWETFDNRPSTPGGRSGPPT